MAKTSGKTGGGTSRIRFIMLDAELPDGDLTQITSAIQNALRPTGTGQRLVASQTSPAAPANGKAPELEPDVVENDHEESVSDAPDVAPAARNSGPRKYRTPKAVRLDLNGDPSFEDYAASKNPTSDQMRYLVAAAWLKQHRSLEQITMDHVYTCFRVMKWPSGIEDFDAPLRALKRRQLLEKAGKGAYSINHLGLNEVDKMGAA